MKDKRKWSQDEDVALIQAVEIERCRGYFHLPVERISLELILKKRVTDLTKRHPVGPGGPTGRGNSISWNEVAKSVPTRSNKDCRKRFMNGMAEKYKKVCNTPRLSSRNCLGTAAHKRLQGPWSEEEDDKLKQLISKHGTSWAEVSRSMGTRSADRGSPNQ